MPTAKHLYFLTHATLLYMPHCYPTHFTILNYICKNSLHVIYFSFILFLSNLCLIRPCSMLVKPITAVDFHKPHQAHADVVYLLQTCVTVNILLHFCTTPAICIFPSKPSKLWPQDQVAFCGVCHLEITVNPLYNVSVGPH